MASLQFCDLSDADINYLVSNRLSEPTRKLVKQAGDTFTKFLATRSVTVISSYIVDELLERFYLSVRRQDGQPYKAKSLHALKYGLQVYIRDEYQIDVSDTASFPRAALSFKTALTIARKEGRGVVNHKEPISDSDLRQLYEYFDPDTPNGLQEKVWFDIMYYFCRRGRENLHLMTKDTYAIGTDEKGRTFIYQKTEEMNKNHRYDSTDPTTQARMYSNPQDSASCPVSSFNNYMSLLHPAQSALWQRPKKKGWELSDTWYENRALGVNTIGTMMSTISESANLSRRYTNHCIRATAITMMDRMGCEGRHIIKISGHSAVASLKPYCQNVTSDQLYTMSAGLMAQARTEKNTAGNVSGECCVGKHVFQCKNCSVTINI